MHEWALAEAVIAAALQAAEEEDLQKITEVKVRIGQLQQIENDIFEFALSQLRSGKLANARFVVGSSEAKMQCRACGHEWTLDQETLGENEAEAIHFIPETAHTYIKCPKCGSPDFEILEGRGVWLESLKGAK